MTKVLPPLHAIINCGCHLCEVGVYQNARHAFPNSIPFRGKGKNAIIKKALEVSEKALYKKANERPLNIPLGQMGPSGVGFLFNYIYNTYSFKYLF